MRSADDLPDRARDDEQVRDFARNRERFRDDPLRPRYHFTPPGGILHDPNGACYWNGRYHLFYQFFPPDLPADRPWDEAMHWGHAVSDDLVHWQDLPIALSADSGPERSCYSGQALVEDERVVLLYHGPGAGNCVATAGDPFLLDVEKHPENPVIPIDADAPYRVFDPCIWKADDAYYALSGSYVDGERGEDCRNAEFLFRSADLAEWEYRGTLLEDGFHTEPGEDGAVPNFLSLGDRHLLLFFSHPRGPQYYLGRYDPGGDAFEIEHHGRLNHGPMYGNLHAPSALVDGDGRRIAFFNVTEGTADRRGAPTDGWAEVLSLPRVLGVEGGRLTMAPAPELETLRAAHRRIEPGVVPANGERVIEDAGGASIEVGATIAVGDAREVGLSVLRSPGGEEETAVKYWDRAGALGIDTSRSSERADVLGRPPEVGSLELDADEPLRLRVFVDRSIVEVFANGRRSLTARAYPGRADSVGLSLFARGGDARLESMDVWELRDAQPA